MLYRTRGHLPLWDCNGKTIKEGDVVDYKNPKFQTWSGELHTVVWNEQRLCYCLERHSDMLMMRIGAHGKWQPERFKIVPNSPDLP